MGTFQSRAQMGWLYRNKRGVHEQKLAQAGDVNLAELPYKNSARNKNTAGRAQLAHDRAKLNAGSISPKEFGARYRKLGRRKTRK